jgi:transposase
MRYGIALAMASVIAKKKGDKTYYYVAESARVNGRPRIINQVYLGTADRLAKLVKDRTAPVPLEATYRDFGLPGALWLAAERSGVFTVLQSIWPEPRSGPAVAHYLVLAAIHRICNPGPKTEVADWYSQTILHQLWGIAPERFTSQAFWDAFDKIRIADTNSKETLDELSIAQSLLLGLWKKRTGFGQRMLAYDTTNFYTFIASTNRRNNLAQRGHNKQGRHNLRQVGMSYVMDGETGLSVCHHVYPGQVTDTVELGSALPRILEFLDANQIPRDSVTLVFDKGTAALANTLLLEEGGVGWISALPWNQAPPALRERPVEEIPSCAGHPSVHAVAEKHIVHGKEYLCVLKYSPSFATEQLQSIVTSMAKATQNLCRLAKDLEKPGCKIKEEGARRKIATWLSPQFLSDLIHCELTKPDGARLRLRFDVNHDAFQHLYSHRLGRTLMLTNRSNWSAAQIVEGYDGQQSVERVFRGLKDGHWLGWGPMYHWTDHNIQVHAFYCMLGVSLLQYIHAEAKTAWPTISMEDLQDQLNQIKQYVLLYPNLGDKGPARTSTIISKHNLVQKALSTALGLDSISARKG